MSAYTDPYPARSVRRGRPSAGISRLDGQRLVAFCILAPLAGTHFAELLSQPPTDRAFGVVAAAAACATGLCLTRSSSVTHARLTMLARAVLVVLVSLLALWVAGIPAGLIWPWHWLHLGRELWRGVDALDGLWPYTGGDAQARLAVMFLVPGTIVPAAALAFWPRLRFTRSAAVIGLALLLCMYMVAAANEPRAGWQVQGVLLLAGLGLWGWAGHARRGPAALPALVIALAVALALVGAKSLSSSPALVNYRSWDLIGSAFTPTSFDWNQTYGPLGPKSGARMVEVSSRETRLWRATTLDRFDGVRFLRSSMDQPALDAHASSLNPHLIVSLNPHWIVSVTFTVRGLREAQLLSPGSILAVHGDGSGGPRVYTLGGDGSASVVGEVPGEGTRYTVIAYAPRPSAAELARAPSAIPAGYRPYTEFELPGRAPSAVSMASAAGLTRLQASPYGRVYALARRLAAGASDAYGVVGNVEAFLRRGFRYEINPPQASYPLISFLFGTRRGYCQQFSGAMALMLRMDGIPARVAAGFLPGSRSPTSGLYDVTAEEAHAWVEVFFPGIGWVPFDPTPAGSSTRNSQGLFPLPQATSDGAAAARERRATGRPLRPPSASRGISRHGAARAGNPLLLELLLAGVAVLLLVAFVWATRRRDLVANDQEQATAELLRALHGAGIPVAPAATLVELEQRLARSHAPAASRYVELLRARRYQAGPDQARPSPSDRRQLRRALSARRSALVRLRVLLALPPLGTGAPGASRRRARN